MDGNNRWSKKNKLNKYNGYKKGANTLIKISNYIFNNTDAKFISAFALSKNNLSRSNNLISTLKKILLEFIDNVEAKIGKELDEAVSSVNNGGINKIHKTACPECGHEYEIPVDFDPVSFFLTS